MDSKRHHYAFRLKDQSEQLDDVLNNVERIRRTLYVAATAGGATVLEVRSHVFDPEGCTVFALLAESHISIHTWPEDSVAELDVFTCGDTIKPLHIGREVALSLGLSVISTVRVDTSTL